MARPDENSPFDFGDAGKQAAGGKRFAPDDPLSQASGLAAPPSRGSHKKDDPLGPNYGYERRRFRRRTDEVSVYTEQMDARYAMDPRTRTLVVLAVLLVVAVPVFTILPSGFLTADGIAHGPAWFFELFASNIAAVGDLVSGTPSGNGLQVVFWQMLALAFVGAALALNGAVYQGALKNALASPSTLGVMSGGTLGGIVYTLTFDVPQTVGDVTTTSMSTIIAEKNSLSVFDYILATQARALCCIAGCFIIVGLVVLIAYIAGRGKVSKTGLVIAGQVFAAAITGVVSVVRTWVIINGTDEQLEALQTMVGGSVTNIMGPIDFALVAVPLTVGFVIILSLRSKLNLLAFNDEEAKSMGLSVHRTRNIMVGVCTIMTAVVVSFCGGVGFVGFLIPHLTRKIIGPDARYLIPASALIGGIYLLVCNYVMSLGDLLSQSLGSFTSIIGVVFFLVVAIQQRRRGNADWV